MIFNNQRALDAVKASQARLVQQSALNAPLAIAINAKFDGWVSVPASARATGTAGQIAYEAGFLYVCVATDTWLRTTLSTW